MKKSRIGILDGFRGIAILSVLCFHFFSRWTPPNNAISLYPYNNNYDYFTYGRLGVQFFFIISGFVIFYTLENTDKFKLFWKKRLIRLWPSIIIVSIITFIFFNVFDNTFIFPESHYSRNFLPSLTFIIPGFFNAICSKPHYFGYINGVYWSLWPEIQFYFFVSILFYANKEQFLRNFIFVSFPLMIINAFFLHVIGGGHKFYFDVPEVLTSFYQTWIMNIFNLVLYLPAFAIGIFIYQLFKSKNNNVFPSLFIKISIGVLLLFFIYSGENMAIRIIYFFMFLLFVCFVYFPDKLSFLENKLMLRIGVCSYFLYLIHENIAVFIINRLGNYFYPAYFILPLILVFLMVALSILYTENIDRKINSYLKKIFLTKK